MLHQQRCLSSRGDARFQNTMAVLCWRSVRHDGGWTRIIFDTRLFIHTAAPKMAGHIRSRFIYIRKQRRNSGARGGQCIIKSEHYVIIMQSYNTSTYCLSFEVKYPRIVNFVECSVAKDLVQRRVIRDDDEIITALCEVA